MKIIAFTDIHGSYKKVEEILRSVGKADVVIIGGDLTTYGTPKEAEAAIKSFQQFNMRLLAVAGNMDIPELDETFADLGVSINGHGVKIQNVGFFGVSAAPYSPLHTPYEISEDEIRKRAQSGYEDVKDCPIKIFVPHAPPYNTKVDKILMGLHVGSKAVREFIEKMQPDGVVCGHIHEARGQDSIGKSKIVNCGPAGKGYYAVVGVGKEIMVSNEG